MSKLTTERARAMGRKSSRKGIPNKSTEEVREAFKSLVSENLEQLQSDLKKLEPHQRIKLVIELAKFVLPTLKSTELKADSQNFKPIVIEWKEH